MEGLSIAHYQVLEEIGSGGMGVVYKAQDTRLGRFVALKFLPEEFANNPEVLARFRREAQASSALNDPNICTVHDIVDYEGRTFIVMEYLEGANVRERIKERGPFAIEEFFRIAISITEGLADAHRHGILHRDIKPANIFITDRGRVKILDFGLAKMGIQQLGTNTGDDDDATKTRGWAFGTVAYMSPEQALGKPLDQRSDIFSLGTVFFEMLAGITPFEGETTGTVFLAVVQNTPVIPVQEIPNTPAGLKRIVGKCLEKDREKRYQSMAELRDDLVRVQQDPEAEPVVAPDPHARVANKSGSFTLTLVVAMIAAVLIVAVLFLRYRSSSGLHSQDKIVIGDLANLTGDATFDRTLRPALVVSLAQSPFFKIATDREMTDTLKRMEKPPDTAYSRDVTREICIRNGGKAFLSGSIRQDRERYAVMLEGVGCSDSKVIATATTAAKDSNGVIAALGSAAEQLRKKMGESLPSLQQFDKALPDATTASLPALQALAAGALATRQTSSVAAIPYLQRAVELDPNFASAYFSLGSAYYNSRQQDLASAAMTKAFELRNRVTERERFQIEAAFYRNVTGELSKQIATCEQAIQSYPDDPVFYTFLGLAYLRSGNHQEAARSHEAARRLAPDKFYPYSNLMATYLYLSKWDEAKLAYDEARKRNLDNEAMRENRYLIAFFENDEGGMREQLDAVKGRANYEDRVVRLAADTESYHGRYKNAREMDRQARGAAGKDNAKDRVAEYLAVPAWREAEIGNRKDAIRLATEALTDTDDPHVEAIAAIALARAGDSAAAAAVADRLAKEHPLDTSIQSSNIPTIRGIIAYNQGKYEDVIATLPVSTLEIGSVFPSGTEATYIRGLAYLKLQKADEAALEFQKMIDHPAAVGNFVNLALAHLQLARAERMRGKTEEARRAYQDFLALWKDADADLAPFREAKAEYAAVSEPIPGKP
ncbi:serine/threonine protein kinase with TPR repeats [Candidatus Koribacter versatilis Ellin345]|uniref:non-specific serine/threonine protein kinase n=1 Tax=Koribacter versatilis (strain Ellin345) TaxID=204669 RepID=Q1IM11_KORVE|nr:serine/threonine-protein kinase [Candidatus Koribacter versatilis]ABF42089.1 serine/threonine protein kinase with TPR repeats [Candidatus Koribacter versatilis Ellin345]